MRIPGSSPGLLGVVISGSNSLSAQQHMCIDTTHSEGAGPSNPGIASLCSRTRATLMGQGWYGSCHLPPVCHSCGDIGIYTAQVQDARREALVDTHCCHEYACRERDKKSSAYFIIHLPDKRACSKIAILSFQQICFLLCQSFAQ